MFGRKIASLSFGFMINVIGAWQRAPNPSSLYSTCLPSWRYQIYLITWTLHGKLSAVSFVANYGVLLSACCKGLFPDCSMWPGSAFPFITVCVWPNENIHYFISTGRSSSARLSWAEPPVGPFAWEHKMGVWNTWVIKDPHAKMGLKDLLRFSSVLSFLVSEWFSC